MHIEGLTRDYSTKSDEELLQLAMELEELTPTAQTVLTNELAKRRINVAEHLNLLGDEGPGQNLSVSEVMQPCLRVARIESANLWQKFSLCITTISGFS